MLWECGFEDADVQWRTDDNDGSEGRLATSSPSTVQLLESMYSSLSSTRIETSLLRHFLSATEVYHQANNDKIVRLQGGGGKIRHVNQYVSLLKRKRGQTPAEVNENWRTGRGVVVAARRLAEREVSINTRSNNSREENYDCKSLYSSMSTTAIDARSAIIQKKQTSRSKSRNRATTDRIAH